MAQIERDRLDVLRFKYQNVRIVNSEERIVNSGVEGVKYEVFLPYKRDNRLDNDYSEAVTDGVSFLNSRMNTQCYAVMYIIKRSILVKNEGANELKNECLFTPGLYFEDTDWTPRMLIRAKRVASTNTIVYNYLIREGSITNAVNRSKQKKVLEDKIKLIDALQNQAVLLSDSGYDNRWYHEMIADVVISIVGMLSIDFYKEKAEYLGRLNTMNILPLKKNSLKARMINFSPSFAVILLHLKNR